MTMMGRSMMNAGAGADAPAPVVVATISAIADVTSGTTAKTPTVSATIDRGDVLGAVTATITAWAWKQDGSTDNITGPTTASPSIAIVPGGHVVTCGVTVEGVVYQSAPEAYTCPPSVYALTLGSQADALGLTGTQFAAPTATKNGASIAITGYAWTVTGPCTLDDDEIERPTPTHTGAGTCTRQLAATLADGAVVYSAVDGWRVGNAAGWVCVWSSSGITDHDHKVTATKTHNGVDLVGYPGATWPTFAWSSGTLTIDTTAGTNGGLTVKIGGVVPATLTGYEIALIFGLGAEITANNDGFFAQYSSIGGTNCIVEARRDAGAQKVKIEALSANTSRNTAGGLQARIIGMQLTPGRTGFRPIYSTSAWSGANGPEPDSLTAGGGTPSGWHSACTLATSASADLFTPDGATQDWVWFAPRSDNGRLFTIPGMAVWVKSPTSLS